MDIVDLAEQPRHLQDQAATLLHESFNTALGWPALEGAVAELAMILQQGFAKGAIQDTRLLGWVGGLPEYRGRVWELHPIRHRITSLADVNLYGSIPQDIAELRDLGKEHPFLFYQKLGFVVTGVMPDANGRGRPDIYMSKPLGPRR